MGGQVETSMSQKDRLVHIARHGEGQRRFTASEGYASLTPGCLQVLHGLQLPPTHSVQDILGEPC